MLCDPCEHIGNSTACGCAQRDGKCLLDDTELEIEPVVKDEDV